MSRSWRFAFLGLLTLAGSIQSFAEYRAFQLKIENSQTQQSRQVITTLDPQQYTGYYAVEADEVVSMVNTWMCRGRTDDFQETCIAPQRKPSQDSTSAPLDGASAENPPPN